MEEQMATLLATMASLMGKIDAQQNFLETQQNQIEEQKNAMAAQAASFELALAKLTPPNPFMAPIVPLIPLPPPNSNVGERPFFDDPPEGPDLQTHENPHDDMEFPIHDMSMEALGQRILNLEIKNISSTSTLGPPPSTKIAHLMAGMRETD